MLDRYTDYVAREAFETIESYDIARLCQQKYLFSMVTTLNLL